jgi:hypothetical protein
MASILRRIARVIELFIPGAVIGWCAAAYSGAFAGEQLSGKALFLVASTITIPLRSFDDEHVVVHAAERGIQLKFSSTDLLENCSFLRISTCDLTRDRGSCFGYHIFESHNGDQLLAKFSGVRLTDTNQGENSPEDMLRGTWVFVRGSGKFANIKGGGSYRGQYVSSSEYTLEWNGEFYRATENGVSNLDRKER